MSWAVKQMWSPPALHLAGWALAWGLQWLSLQRETPLHHAFGTEAGPHWAFPWSEDYSYWKWQSTFHLWVSTTKGWQIQWYGSAFKFNSKGKCHLQQVAWDLELQFQSSCTLQFSLLFFFSLSPFFLSFFLPSIFFFIVAILFPLPFTHLTSLTSLYSPLPSLLFTSSKQPLSSTSPFQLCPLLSNPTNLSFLPLWVTGFCPCVSKLEKG